MKNEKEAEATILLRTMDKVRKHQYERITNEVEVVVWIHNVFSCIIYTFMGIKKNNNLWIREVVVVCMYE